MPGFLVFVVEAGLEVVVAAEEEAGGSEEGFERNDVPGVLGNDVGGEEVDFAGKILDGAASGAAVGVEVVHIVFELRGTFDLDAPEGGVPSRPHQLGLRSKWRNVRSAGHVGFRLSASGFRTLLVVLLRCSARKVGHAGWHW